MGSDGNMSYVLVIDLGTSCCKAAILDEKGNIIIKHRREYDIIFPEEGWAEQDPDQVWKMVKEVIAHVTRKIKYPENIKGIGLSLQGEAVIPVDKDGNPLYRTILGMDTRCIEENKYLKELFGEEYLYNRTGMPIHTVNTLPKILWLKNNKPSIFKKTWKFVLYEGFLSMKLCGEPVVDACLASRTQMYDINKKEWSEEIASKTGIEIEKLSRIVEPGEIIGEVKKELLEEFGLNGPVFLVAGGHDQACAALGSGLINDFATMDSIGTAEVIEVATTSLHLNKDLMEAKISTYRHVVSDMYLTMTLNHTAGILIRWFIDNFFQEEVKIASDIGKDRYDYIFKKILIDHPSYKFVVPHFNGSGTPWVNEEDLGMIMGLNLSDDKYSLLKAFLEGLVYELKVNVRILEENGYNIKELITVGGGAKSIKWLKIKAAILNKNLITTQDRDVAIMGAYILAANAIDIFSSIRQGVRKIVFKKYQDKIKPDNQLRTRYQELFDIYQKVYSVNKDINSKIFKLKK